MSGLVPIPLVEELQEGELVLDSGVSVTADAAMRAEAEWLAVVLRESTGWTVPLVDSQDALVRFEADEDRGSESYRLEITQEGIIIAAGGPAGALYAAQSLRQLLGPTAYRRARVGALDPLPLGVIEDEPRFRWRGLMLDVARHFMPKNSVFRVIDAMALHKLNTLHLHLTDDQGWRVEIQRYPRLTEVGSWRTQSHMGAVEQAVFDTAPHGGFYTQDDIREIVAYAGRLHITVVPEIDVPGHVQALLAAYPEHSVHGEQLPVRVRSGLNDNVLRADEDTVRMVCEVFDEVMELFPGRWIGIGGDEVPRVQWERDPHSQSRANELGLPDASSLYGWLLQQFAAHISSAGRVPVAWDEILEIDVPDDVLVMSWRGYDGGVEALWQGRDVVMSPNTVLYFDTFQSDGPDEPLPIGDLISLPQVYAFEVLPPGTPPELEEHVLGAQANVWTELLETQRRVDFNMFPRVCALAEALWSPREKRDYDDFEARLRRSHLPRLAALGIEYRPLDGPHPWQSRPGFANWVGDLSEDRPHQAYPEEWPDAVEQTHPGAAVIPSDPRFTTPSEFALTAEES
ncbi:beta-N-acetylhexosaminidase [Microbacterium saperdae]|nr:beta-N-acetylhexosaminidase [Microbacterium saperdae]